MLLYNHIYMYAGLAHFSVGVRKMIIWGGGDENLCPHKPELVIGGHFYAF